jgi:hypothetical protein
LKDVADEFVRVRLTRIDDLDLNLFDFDYDLTFMVFFLNSREQVYARYGGRDAQDPDRRQSLAGLRYTMQSVLRMHEQAEPVFAPRREEAPRIIRRGFGPRSGHCMHCHQVKEELNADLRKAGQRSQDLVWRYPLPENLGFALEIDRGNLVREVKDHSPAAAAGLKVHDILLRLHGMPIHSFADAQYALDRAPKAGRIEIRWLRGNQIQKGQMPLVDGWRKTDISWRPSMREFVPSARLYGADLTAQEKQALHLPARQLAFRQKHPLSALAEAAGIRQGDVIVGIDDKSLEMDVAGFQDYVRSHYLVGDKVTINILRDGQRHDHGMTLSR